MKKALATLLTISVLFIMGGINYPSLQADETEFSLIDYLETHEINSNVKVGVVKSSGTYGKKTTRVNKGATKKCYSYQVIGNDGLSAWVQYYVA